MHLSPNGEDLSASCVMKDGDVSNTGPNAAQRELGKPLHLP